MHEECIRVQNFFPQLSEHLRKSVYLPAEVTSAFVRTSMQLYVLVDRSRFLTCAHTRSAHCTLRKPVPITISQARCASISPTRIGPASLADNSFMSFLASRERALSPGAGHRQLNWTPSGSEVGVPLVLIRNGWHERLAFATPLVNCTVGRLYDIRG